MTSHFAERPEGWIKRRILSQLSGDGLRARAVRGSALTLGSFAVGKLLRLGSNLILTRLLFPEAFGLMALVMVVMTGLQMFSDTGIRLSIIQNSRGDEPDFLNTAWTLQIARGALLWLATCALAGPVAAFYEEPILASLLQVAGLSLFIQGFNSTRMYTANRHLQMGRLILIRLGGQVLTIVATIILALLLGTVWSLVFGMLVGAVATLVMSHTVLPGLRNRPVFEAGAARALFGFGKYIFLSTIAGFLINQGDRAIVGKFVALSDLAVYTIAFLLATVPLELGRVLADTIAFPLYRSRPPAESAGNRAKIRQARYLLTGLVFALTLPFALFGDHIVRLLYDSRYHEAGPLLILIAVAALPILIVVPYRFLPLAAGHSGRFAVMNTIDAGLRTAALLFGIVHFGLVGAALAPAIAGLAFYPVYVWMLVRYRGLDLAHDALFTGLACLIAALAVWLNIDVLSAFVAAKL